ncbi:MAG: Ig-like domain-containing protein [Candidatus Daviesbacteria bacterium]|nr:Ig-like domain-containing protein [Candidatus Daviesbacteria bacterium]
MINQKGFAHILILLAALGIILFLLISSSAPFKDKLFSLLYPKPPSYAAEQSVPDEVIIKFKPGVSDEAKDNIRRAHGLEKKSEVEQIGVELNKVPEKAKDKIIEALNKNPRVEYAEPNMIAQLQDIPNDPEYTSGRQWTVNRLAMPVAWDISKGDPNVVVAVFDSGVNSNHEDLVGKILPGFNYLSNNTDTSDQSSHGTGVIGTITAITNNSLGVASLGRDVSVEPYVVCGSNNSCGSWGAVLGIPAAADRGVKVANMSWGGSCISGGSLQDAINYGFSKGLISVAAAGNYGGAVLWPACLNNVIAAGGSDSSDNRWTGSSYGVGLDVMAPGGGVRTTTATGGYAYMSGTSFSSPLTAALAALIYSANTDLTAQQVVDIITSTADKISGGCNGYDSNGWSQYCGYGRINAGAALQKAVGIVAPPPDTLSPVVKITNPTSGSTISGVIDFTADITDNVGITRAEFYCSGCTPGLIATDTTAPYGVSLDTTKLTNGQTYSLYVRAYDAAGNVNPIQTIPVTVNNSSLDLTPPTTSITQPSNGQTVSQAVTVNASASDNIGLTTISIFVDGSIVTACSVSGTSSNCSYSWDSISVSNGSHTIQSKALDSSNNLGQSSIITVSVNNVTSTPIPSPTPNVTTPPITTDPIPPTVSITNPTDGASISRSSSVNISADATDNISVSKVEFYVNNSTKCTDTSLPYSCNWRVPGKRGTSYTLTAKAYDSSNNSATGTVTVKVP